jgi:serine/threonine protein kinase
MLNSKPMAFHRDIKTANILLDAHGVAKVADFGLASTVGKGRHFTVKEVSGSPGYSCPSYIETGRVSEQTEAYSFGIVLLELLTGLPPAQAQPNGGEKPDGLVYPLFDLVQLTKPGPRDRIISGLDATVDWPQHVASEIADLALACVATRQEKRPSFEQMVQRLRSLCGNTAASKDNQPLLLSLQPQQKLARQNPVRSSGRPIRAVAAAVPSPNYWPTKPSTSEASVFSPANDLDASAPVTQTDPGDDECSGHFEWLQPPTDILQTILSSTRLFTGPEMMKCCTIDRVGPERTCAIEGFRLGEQPPRPRPAPPCTIAA